MPWSPLPTPDGDGGPGPASVTSALDTVLAGLGGPSVEAIVLVHERWAEVIGDEVVAVAQPVSIENGTLRIRANGAAWASHIRWSEAEILGRLDDVVGPGVVTALKVVVGRS